MLLVCLAASLVARAAFAQSRVVAQTNPPRTIDNVVVNVEPETSATLP